MKRAKLEGTTYCHWKILSFHGVAQYKAQMYDCICVCGKRRLVRGNGKKLASKSCGCMFNRGRTPKTKEQCDLYAGLFSRYRKDAINRNHPFLLSRKEFRDLVSGPCYYCNSQEESVHKYNRFTVYYTGIDRVDNTKGYIKSNCVSCCKQCNNFKKAVTPDIIKKAYIFLFGEKSE